LEEEVVSSILPSITSSVELHTSVAELLLSPLPFSTQIQWLQHEEVIDASWGGGRLGEDTTRCSSTATSRRRLAYGGGGSEDATGGRAPPARIGEDIHAGSFGERWRRGWEVATVWVGEEEDVARVGRGEARDEWRARNLTLRLHF
jgi:hypothetical protein